MLALWHQEQGVVGCDDVTHFLCVFALNVDMLLLASRPDWKCVTPVSQRTKWAWPSREQCVLVCDKEGVWGFLEQIVPAACGLKDNLAMFPNAPLYPGFVVRGGDTVVLCRSRLLSVLMLNVFMCVLMVLTWKLGLDHSGLQRVHIPSRSFWCQQAVSGSFWNKEQQRLDALYNPLLGPTHSRDRLNDTGPVDTCEADHRVLTQVWDYNTLPRRLQDFLLYMRCRKYRILITPGQACHQDLFLLLAVKTLVPHFGQRQAIRQTWGRTGVLANRTVATVFLLGQTLSQDHFPDLRGMLGREAELHGDLLQWEFRDTFLNLTLKEALFLDWFHHNCPRARYVLKADDEVLVNTLRVLDFLEALPLVKSKDLFVGDVIWNAGPHRDQKLKYFVPQSVFTGEYPPYAGGGGYLLSGDVALRLQDVSRQVVLYPIDNVYTGMCLQKLGLVPETHSGFRTFDIDDEFRENPCAHRKLMLVHSRTPQEMLKIWTWIVRPHLGCQ
ncbi:N-acetyllactosaminide beta-1,3-N-acetylglucosaminyltransferase 2a [Dunckerocampus dactyliophorus]|uniref:N-acetyllactosaminide beta-1,3-N-acetylglucosaminyltransferase 2a n=1 Tax=Dunckerocampus dactyliophorus TaxID=161453 RepID=UPI002404A9FC|nr:N-acetyllactosaminide beta-1,3-N-acetylglucosaminyltransferase 2a [Dunckerocampus dactyliophorus]